VLNSYSHTSDNLKIQHIEKDGSMNWNTYLNCCC